MFWVAETDICILEHGLDWSNLSRSLVMYQYGFYQCSSNHNETFKGTETCMWSCDDQKGWSPEDQHFIKPPPKQ